MCNQHLHCWQYLRNFPSIEQFVQCLISPYQRINVPCQKHPYIIDFLFSCLIESSIIENDKISHDDIH